MSQSIRSFLNKFRDSKILPGKNIFEVSFFFVIDRLFKVRGALFTQAFILKFLIEERYIKRNYFMDRVRFSKFTLYDYIIYGFNDKGFSRGTSFSSVEALGKCLGEVLERVPFRDDPEKKKGLYSNVASLKQKGVSFLDLKSLSQSTDEQKRKEPLLAYDEFSSFEWTDMFSFKNRSLIYAPKQLVYWNHLPERPEKIIKESNTNGVASDCTEAGAIFSALSECLQRHIFFKAWYFPEEETVYEVDLVDLAARFNEIGNIQQELRYNMLHPRLFRIETELSPLFDVYFCVLENSLTGGVYIGCSGGQDSYTSLYRAIQESLSIYTFTNRILFNGEGEKSYEQVPLTEFDYGIYGNHRVIWWGHHLTEEGKKVLNGFLGSKKEKYVRKFATKDSILERVLNEFGDFFYKVSEDPINQTMNHFSARVILPYSYSLALSEHISTPVLRSVYPQNSYVHPFP